MRQILAIIIVVLLFLGLIGGLLWYLAYGVEREPPPTVAVAALGDTVDVSWRGGGWAVIRAADESDVYAGIGYAHGRRHLWTMVLMRRTALGRLAESFGDEMLLLDRLTRQLGLAGIAQEAYRAMDEEERRLLESYSVGLNAALAHSRLTGELVLLEINPAAWEPWHSIAVERLIAWLAAPRPSSDSLAQTGQEVREFFEADRKLRQWLHLHGFENSAAWTMTDSAGTRLFQRHVTGASALPLYQEIVIQRPGGEQSGASLIGTPFFPAGQSAAAAWAVLPSSRLTLSRSTADPEDVPMVYERAFTADGEEHLIEVRRSPSRIFFPGEIRPVPRDTGGTPTDTLDSRPAAAAPGASGADLRPSGDPGAPPPAPDMGRDGAAAAPASDTVAVERLPGWILEWSGFGATTDFDAWRALFTNEDRPFTLFDGNGIVVTTGGSVRVLGTPVVQAAHQSGVLVAGSDWSQFVAMRLDSVAMDILLPESPRTSRFDTYSVWAAQLAPALVESAVAVPDQSPIVAEVLTYLRNWDFDYDRASIAAPIFEAWIKALEDSTGRLPEPTLSDTALSEVLLRYDLLVRAVDALQLEFGSNLSQWRWEDVQPKVYQFPVWSADSLSAAGAGVRETRYAPVQLPGAGHPSTIDWGPSDLGSDLKAPASWEAWISTSDWGGFRVRRLHVDPNRFFGRYLVSDRPPEPIRMDAAGSARNRVALVPR